MPLAHLRRRDAWLAYAQAIVDRVSLREAARRAGIVLDTSFGWRHRFLKMPQDNKPATVKGIVEADETPILKSARGSRKQVGRLSHPECQRRPQPLRGLARAFKGLATKYLASYLGWHRMKDRDGSRLTPTRCIYAACGFA